MASSAGQEKRKTPLPYVQQKFASQDKRFQAALAEADALYTINHGDRGAEFEEDVRSVLGRFLPYTYDVHGGFMSPIGDPKDGLKKQLDIIIRSRLLPELMHAVPVELITVAGEVKTTFSGNSKRDYLATAQTLMSGAARAGRRRPLPFFALAGALDRAESGHASWLTSVVSDAAIAAPDGPGLWPAFFSFDERSSMSAIPVGPSAPLSAVTVDGEELIGIISIAAEHLSVSAVCYLWLWACLYSFEDAPSMEMRYMRDALYRELTDGRGLRAEYWPLSGDGDPQAATVSLLFTAQADAYASPDPDQRPMPSSSVANSELEAGPVDEPPAGEPGRRRFILITLGSWVEEPDSWDESLWGGSGTASRRGRGYYEGMTDQELLDASRLFWRFNRDSGHWDGIDYAVVAHGGIIRAVIRITNIIGPLWNRYGFQGHLVQDSDFARKLIGQPVPARQNPITTIEL